MIMRGQCENGDNLVISTHGAKCRFEIMDKMRISVAIIRPFTENCFLTAWLSIQMLRVLAQKNANGKAFNSISVCNIAYIRSQLIPLDGNNK